MDSLFAGGGEMRAMLRERFGWGNAAESQPSIGAISEWPQSLRTAVSLCLASPQPIALGWGRDYLWFYNDAYCLLEQTQHPQCLGRPGREWWAEDGNRMTSLLDSVRETGVSTCLEDVQRIVTRTGYAEETYFTFTYSPIQDESGGVGGVFCTCAETTKRVLSGSSGVALCANRRLKTLRELSVNTSQAETVKFACTLAVETLAQNSYDLPFALLYVVEAEDRRAYLAGTAGMEAGTIASPQQVDLATATDAWHLAQVKTTGQAHQINGLAAQLKASPEGGWENAPDAAIVLPLRPSGPKQQVIGLLVLGISPRREFDDDYRGFFDLIASNVATVVANANAYETKITEPKPSEIALQRREERYWAFVAQSSEAIWCFELEKPVPISCSEDEQIQRFYQYGYLSECNQTMAGEERWVAARGRVEYDSQGRPVAFPGTLADISDRKQVEESLRQSEVCAQLAIGVGRLGTWRYDLGANLVELDERMREIWGEPPDVGLLPLSVVMERIHPDDQARVAEAISAALDPGSLGVYDIEYRIVWADQTEHWVLANGLTQFEGEGLSRRVVSFIGTAIDITYYKQIEEALRQREAELRVITNTLPVLISFIDSEQHYRFNNHTYKEWFGCSASEIYGKHVREVLGEDAYKVIRPHIEQVLSGQQASFESEVPYAAVGPRYVRVTYVPRFGAQGTVEGFVVLVNDISEAKRDEAEREQLLAREQAAQEQAVAANRIKDEFLAVLSHELRTPMNPILGWSKLLRAGKLDAMKTDHALETIDRNAKLQTQLIEDLLDVSRILQGKLNLKMAPVNLEATLEAALETLRLAIEAKSIQVHTRLEPISGQVLGDSARLQQVIWNLLSNAVKFTPEGGRIEIRLNYTALHTQLQVRDTGRGIAASFLPHVFEYFRQADGPTTRTFGGLGLGLAIVRHLVELHGGTVRAESAGESQGATFTVKLPLLKPEETMQNKVPTSSASSPHPLSHLRILLVDDDADTQELNAFILRQAGAIVTSVGSAIAALAALPQTKPQVLVTDIGMPEIDGYELIRQVRALPQGERILAIALTAYAGEINAQHAIAAGFQRHLSKPVEPEMLIAAIAALATPLNRETD